VESAFLDPQIKQDLLISRAGQEVQRSHIKVLRIEVFRQVRRDGNERSGGVSVRVDYLPLKLEQNRVHANKSHHRAVGGRVIFNYIFIRLSFSL